MCIIVGEQPVCAQRFVLLLEAGEIKQNVDILLTDSTEAEVIKLFSNTFLTKCMSFFIELDRYTDVKELDTKQIIEGIGYDISVSDHYNYPSLVMVIAGYSKI